MRILIEIIVYKIKGKCPVYQLGDKIIIDPPKIDLKKSTAICIHALENILHYVIAIDNGIDSVKLGLTTSDDPEHYYIQCVDPGPPFTEGGTVIFKCKKVK
ncbi:MAG: TIGR04076 family protein [Candidatus Odinarchaeia archaeon]